MDMTNEEYGKYVKRMSPDSPVGRDLFHAFWIGGLICAVGERVPRAFIKGGKIVSVRDNVYDADIKETL